jgi:hypothetical protein
VGLEWSLEKIRDWRSQYDRMLRWHVRLKAVSSLSDDDLLDFYLAFFLTCYHLQEWLAESGAGAPKGLLNQARANIHMRLCRDICNRSKHFTIKSASVDSTFSIAREYRRRESKPSLVVLAGGEKFDLDETVQGCVSFWNDALKHILPNAADTAPRY